MACLCKVLASHLPDQELRVGGANFRGTAFAGPPVIVGAASRVPCVLQTQRSCAVHSARCQRAFVLQTNRARPTPETHTRQQPRHQAAVCLCGYRASDLAMSRLMLVRIMANTFVHMTARRGGEATRPLGSAGRP